MSVLPRVKRQWQLAVMVVLTAIAAVVIPISAPAVTTVTIGNGPELVDGSYLNAQNIANNLVFTSVAVAADTSITVGDDINLASSIYGIPAFDLSLIAPTINVGANVNFSGYGNVFLTANTVNLSGKLTSGGSLINPSRLFSPATQVNVLNNAASIQQAVDMGKHYPTTLTTVQVSPGQYNENLTIAKAGLTLRGNDGTAAPGADPAAPEIFGTQAGGQTITVTANNITIDGLHLNGAVAGGSLADSVNGIYANGVDNLTISQNTFEGFSGASISTPGSTNVTLAANLTISTEAMPGALDSSFGTGGTVTNNLGFNYAAAEDAALQADGKIVAAGACGPSETHDSCIARFNSNGSPDTSFDGDGVVIDAAGGGGFGGVAVQSDGKIVAAGNLLARYNANGSLDTSFDGDGKVANPIGPSFIRAVAIQSDGKIVVAAECNFSGFGTSDFCLARLNSNGTFDASFDGDGLVTSSIGVRDSAWAVAIQGDGKIVAAGGCNTSEFGPNDFCVARYNANGTLDTSFDGDGKVTTAIGTGTDTAYDIALQADGKILAAGGCGSDFCLARYNGNGSLDTTFDSDGLVTTNVGTSSLDFARGVAVQSDGKIVAVLGCQSIFCLARYNSNGSLDTSFDSDGLVSTDVDVRTGWRDITTEVLIQSDGRIVAAGYCRVDDDTKEFCLARYGGGGATNQAPEGANDSYSVVQGNPLSVLAASGVLSNDTDPDAGTTLSAVLDSGPSHGTLTLASNGSFLYTPVAVYSGSDTFTYRASDGSLTSNLVTVTINVTGLSSIINSQPKLSSGQKASLNDKLAAAATLFGQGKLNPACGKLNEFITQVNGLVPTKLSASTATLLINGAKARKTYYGCPA